MRRAARVDENHKEIVEALRQIGATVKSVAPIKGFVDIVVGFRGENFLIEIKDGSKPPSQQRLTPLEAKFQREWMGQVETVTSVSEAILLVTTKRI